MSIGTLWWTSILKSLSFLHLFSEIYQKFSRLSFKLFQAGLSELLFTNPYEFFVEQLLPWKKSHFWIFQICVAIFLIFWKFSAGLWKLLLTSPYELLVEKNVFEKLFFIKSFILERKLSKICWSIRQGCGNCNARVNLNNLMKNLLKSSSSLSEIGRNCILKVQGLILLKEILTWKNCLFIVLQAWKTIFWSFCWRFPGGVVKTASLESLEGRHLCWINSVCL